MALPLERGGATAESRTRQQEQQQLPLRGRAFCFLPLPLPTGLPVHANGCFALTSNRRELWAEDADRPTLSHQHARKARWNALLCRAALPKLYAHALELLAASLEMMCTRPPSAAHPATTKSAAASAAPFELSLSRTTSSSGNDGGGVLALCDLMRQLWPVHGEGHGALWRLLQRELLCHLHASRSRVCVCSDPSGLAVLAPLADVVLADAAIAWGAGASEDGPRLLRLFALGGARRCGGGH